MTLQDYRTIDSAAAPGSAYHAATLVTLDGSGYSGDLTLIGSAGANVLRGGLGNNTFTGYQGNNDIWAQAGALSNKLSENGSWNFVLTNTGLQATHVDDGLGTNGGAGAVLSNTLHGVFTDAMLNGGLNATLIDASAFSGNTVLVSGLMSGGVIKAGNGANRQHQIILLGGVYDITGGTGLNASTELVAMADGLTGATAAELKADADARKGAGWLALRTSNASAGWDGWIQRGATDITGSKFRNITSAKVVGGDYSNWIDTSEFRGGSASTAAPAARTPSSSATPTSATSSARPATTPSASPRAPTA